MFDSPQPQTAQLNNYILLISRQILLAVGIIVVSVISDYYIFIEYSAIAVSSEVGRIVYAK